MFMKVLQTIVYVLRIFNWTFSNDIGKKSVKHLIAML